MNKLNLLNKTLLKIMIILAVIAGFILIGGTAVEASNSFALPNADTNVHTYMDYRCITDTASNQYKLQKDKNVYTSRAGIRCYKDENGSAYFLVAMAPYYADNIGDVFRITLDNGSSFKVMVGDIKGKDAESTYGHSCWNFRSQKNCINIVEFIVDKRKLGDKVLDWGTMTAVEYFDGNVESVEYLGRGWNEKIGKE